MFGKKIPTLFIATAIITFFGGSLVFGQDTGLEFDRYIKPILSDHCFHCHGPDSNTRAADLRLDTQEGLFSVVEPGTPQESELVQRILSKDHDVQMPPPAAKIELSEKQKQVLVRWVASGAKWSKHWAFEPPIRKKRPAVAPEFDDWASNPIDAFVLNKLIAVGLNPNPPSERTEWLRRVTFDLTGLPPTLKEIRDFVEDDSADAFEKVADRLLESPAYGERMAWPWLDAARYADTNGFQGDRTRTMWPWRDWVIQSFNENKPFDEFTREQIAGDLIPNATFEQTMATGFFRNHMINGEGGRIAEENRVEYVFDQVETLGTVWMGLTLTCCRCHDHKFDPISAKEYYQLFDYFNQTPVDGKGGDPQTSPVVEFLQPDQRLAADELKEDLSKLRSAQDRILNEFRGNPLAWSESFAKKLGNNQWKRIKPISAKAKTQTLSILDDRSILASGENPKNDFYVIELPHENSITGIRLEALRHDSMFQGGLARSNSGNFVLTDIQVEFVSEDDDAKPLTLKIETAEADFEQGTHQIEKAFDGDPKSGWAVYQGRPVDRDHQAIFRFSAKSPDRRGNLRIRLNHQSPHVRHNLGRFRFSTTAAHRPTLPSSNRGLISALKIAPNKRNSKQTKLVEDYRKKNDVNYLRLNREVRRKEQKLNKILKPAPKVMVLGDRTPRRQTYVLEKGSYRTKLEKVTAQTPSVLPESNSSIQDQNRLTLAKWLLSNDHPLTARVAVNRNWQMFFGLGLVKTTEDFGVQGERPSHPDLLDWLSREYIHSQWDTKRLHRLIVTSATYRQSSQFTKRKRELDPDNKWLSRGPRRRLSSWMLRDQALATSGLLSNKLGGPPVQPYQPQGVWAEATFGKQKYQQSHGESLYRRSLYTFWRRIIGPTMLFDVAKRQTCSVQVTTTNTPLHALVTLNDTTYVEAARVLAQNLLRSNKTIDEQISQVFQQLTTRQPNPEELAILIRQFESLVGHYSKQTASGKLLVEAGEFEKAVDLEVPQHAALTSVCLTIMNLDEALSH